MFNFSILTFHIFCFFLVSRVSAQDLQTIAQKSNWLRTGRAQESLDLCHKFQKKYPSLVRCKSYGTSGEGRNLHYLEVGNKKFKQLPTIWVQAGIHAGEIDGKDATYKLLHDYLSDKDKKNIFNKIKLIFIPIVNIDGHERFSAYNRPNQNGPEEMGWRTTAENFNLNRDFMKLDALEMQSLISLWHKIDPMVSLDLHVTNGAQFQPEVGVITHPTLNFGSTKLHELGTSIENDVMIKLKQKNRMALPFYPSFETDDRPLSGFARYVSQPRFAHGYWYNNDRIGILVESHSWKDYKTRVQTHYDVVDSILELAAIHANEWKEVIQQLDLNKLAGLKVDLEYKHTDKKEMIDFPGYKFQITHSKIANMDIIKYDPTKKENWRVPFYQELKPTLTVEAPKHGYLIPKSLLYKIKHKLEIHHINFENLIQNRPKTILVFRANKTSFSQNSFEGHQTLSIEGKWQEEHLPSNMEYVLIPINQKHARLILQLFEPMAKDSFAAWGFFNTFFERKEYMESYVANEVAQEYLNSADIKKEFQARLEADSEFANDPEKRLDFFYQKHPSWDAHYNRYPILKY